MIKMDTKVIEQAKFDLEAKLEESFRQFDPAQVIRLRRRRIMGVFHKYDPSIIDTSESKVVIKLGPYETGTQSYVCAKLPKYHLHSAHELREYLELINIVGSKFTDDKTDYHFITQRGSYFPSEENAQILREIGFLNVAETVDVRVTEQPNFYANISEDLTRGEKYVLHPAKEFPYHLLGWPEGARQFEDSVRKLRSLRDDPDPKYKFTVDRGHVTCDEKEAAERIFFVIDDPKLPIVNHQRRLVAADFDHFTICRI